MVIEEANLPSAIAAIVDVVVVVIAKGMSLFGFVLYFSEASEDTRATSLSSSTA
jgi:hypothetical protein